MNGSIQFGDFPLRWCIILIVIVICHCLLDMMSHKAFELYIDTSQSASQLATAQAHSGPTMSRISAQTRRLQPVITNVSLASSSPRKHPYDISTSAAASRRSSNLINSSLNRHIHCMDALRAGHHSDVCAFLTSHNMRSRAPSHMCLTCGSGSR